MVSANDTPGAFGFSLRSTPPLIATHPIGEPGADRLEGTRPRPGGGRDRAPGCVFGRRGGRPFNAEEMRRLYVGDIDAILASCAEDLEWGTENIGAGEVPWGGVRHGRAEVQQYFDALAEHVDVDVFEQLDFLTSENQVAVVIRQEATLKKNGQEMNLPQVIGLWTFGEGGKVTRTFNAYDPTAFLAAWRR